MPPQTNTNNSIPVRDAPHASMGEGVVGADGAHNQAPPSVLAYQQALSDDSPGGSSAGLNTSVHAGSGSEPEKRSIFLRILSRADVILALLLIFGALGLFWSLSREGQDGGPTAQSILDQYGSVSLPLEDFVLDGTGSVSFADKQVIVNGNLQANGSTTVNGDFILAPQAQPVDPLAGQIYYNQTSNVLAYYNGSAFVNLADGVTSIEGAGGITVTDDGNGNITLTGSGAAAAADGVTSFQGQTGAVGLAQGNGIGISGTTISNTGVVSLVSTNSTLVVTDDDNGNYELTVDIGGAGVISLNSLSGALNVQGTANQISVNDNGSDTITLSTPQDIATSSSPTFSNITLQGGSATLGTTSQQGSLVLHDGSGQTTTIQAGNSGGNLTFILPTNTGSQWQCLKKSATSQLIWDACEGGGGGSSTDLQDAYENGNTILATDADGDIDLSVSGATNFSVDITGTGSFLVQDGGVDLLTVADGGAISLQSGSSAITIGGGAQTGAVQVGTGTGVQTINLGTGGTGAKTVTLGSTDSTSTTSIQAGTGGINLRTESSDVLVRGITSDSTEAFQVQDVAGAGLLTVDTAARSASGGNLIKIGDSTGTDGALTMLQLDATTADPTTNLAALNGSLFYNSTTHKISLIENGQVKIICNTTDLGCGTGTVTLQDAYTNSTGGTTSEIILDTTRGAVDIQDRSTSNGGTIGANLFNIRATAANDSTAGMLLFGVGNTGAVTLQNAVDSATAFEVLNQAGTVSVLSVDTSSPGVVINGAGTEGAGGTLEFGIGAHGPSISRVAAADAPWFGEDVMRLTAAGLEMFSTASDPLVDPPTFTIDSFNGRFNLNMASGFGYFSFNDDSGSSLFNVNGNDGNGEAVFQNHTDSTSGFRILKSNTTALFNVDTLNDRIAVTGGAVFEAGGTVQFSGIGSSAATDNVLCIDASGLVLEGASATTCDPSSERYKENIASLEESMGLELISALRPVTFNYINGDGSTKVGLIAEEVAEVLPEVVAYDDQGRPNAINYEYMVANLIKAMQQQQVQIDALRQGVLSGGLVELTGHIRVGGDTAGTVTIPAGQTSAHVTFDTSYETPPVVTMGAHDFVMVRLKSTTTTGFTLAIPAPATHDIRVNWTALEPEATQ